MVLHRALRVGVYYEPSLSVSMMIFFEVVHDLSLVNRESWVLQVGILDLPKCSSTTRRRVVDPPLLLQSSSSYDDYHGLRRLSKPIQIEF